MISHSVGDLWCLLEVEVWRELVAMVTRWNEILNTYLATKLIICFYTH